MLSRTVYGGRISLLVGGAVAAISVVFGFAIGLVSGYFRRLDNILMRVIDGIMAIPSVLLAIAVVTLTGSGVSHGHRGDRGAGSPPRRAPRSQPRTDHSRTAVHRGRGRKRLVKLQSAMDFISYRTPSPL